MFGEGRDSEVFLLYTLPANGIVTELTPNGFDAVQNFGYRLVLAGITPPSKPVEFRWAPLPPKGAHPSSLHSDHRTVSAWLRREGVYLRSLVRVAGG